MAFDTCLQRFSPDDDVGSRGCALLFGEGASESRHGPGGCPVGARASVLAAGSPFESGTGRGVNPNQHDRSASQSGAVYVFFRKDGKWSQHAYLKAPNSDEYDEFGTGVALTADGTMLTAASSGEDGGSKGADGNQGDNSVRDSGALYVF